jgi:2-phospho-L-lactate guanylyltransferase (CobY/MobA/RfbA family)
VKNSQNTIVIIPVKRFTNSKLRLSHILTSTEREKLSYFMLCDVINTLEEIDQITEIIITTPMIQDIDISEFSKVRIYHDNSPDINKSLKNAINHCRKLHNDLILNYMLFYVSENYSYQNRS